MIYAANVADGDLAEGNEKDKTLIMGPIRAAPGGAEGLNETAIKQLREKFVVEKSREWVDNLRSANGALVTEDAVRAGHRVALLLGNHLGEWEQRWARRSQRWHHHSLRDSSTDSSISNNNRSGSNTHATTPVTCSMAKRVA